MRLVVSDVDESAERAVNLGGHAGRLVAKAKVKRQVRKDVPIVLDIKAEEGFSNRPVSSGEAGVKTLRVVGQEIRERAEIEIAVVLVSEKIESHSLERHAELERMQSPGQEGIVVGLNRGPVIVIAAEGSDASRKTDKAGNVYGRCIAPR